MDNDAFERRRSRFLENEWPRVCPPLYWETDPTHPNFDPALVERVTNWDPWMTMETGSLKHGLIFQGPTGRGKTRLATLALKAQHFRGDSCMFVSGVDFAQQSVQQFARDEAIAGKAERYLQSCKTVDVLLYDDLGKEKATPRFETELYALVEKRTANHLPTLWTTNSTSASLRSRFSEENGEPILRRIGEFTEAIPL
jgi:DNA replication protein DnaC